MRLTVVGCSGSLPGPDSPASCYLVEHDGTRVLLDLGNGALGPLQALLGGAGLDLRAVDAVLLSHLHLDHCADLGALHVWSRYSPGGPQRPIPVLGPTGTRERLGRLYGTAPESLDASFEFRTWQPTQRVGGLTVSTTPAAHPIEAYVSRLEAGGRVLTYSGDTGPCDGLVEGARGADVLLAEAGYGTVDGPPDLHLNGRLAGEAATAAGVARLVITHVSPWFSAGEAAAAARETYAGPVDVAHPGLVVDL